MISQELKCERCVDYLIYLQVLCFRCFEVLEVRFSFPDALFSTLLGSILICLDSQSYNRCLENDRANKASFICWVKPRCVGLECVLPIDSARVRTQGLCVSAAVLHQVSYEDP